MKNMLNDKELDFLAGFGLLEELNKAGRYYDIRCRKTPAPFLPEKDSWLSEAELMKNLKAKQPETFSRPDSSGLSIYVHIPFCGQKCVFCDLYSFYVPRAKEQIVDDYVRALENEIRGWANLNKYAKKKVTTVHFGGGSPLYLGRRRFSKILDLIKERFSINEHAEIALEVTSSQITPENIDFWKAHRVSRIHVGVQTLADHCRDLIGRRENGDTVKHKLSLLLNRDFLVVSADLLYGIPLQTPERWLEDLAALIEMGLDGFALYELNIPPGFAKVLRKNNLTNDKTGNYLMLLAGKKVLNEAGYDNVFFNHYGKERDRNLYFTYPARGEDCLAFGAIADGYVGGYSFRHKKLAQYLTAVQAGELGVEYGYYENDLRFEVRTFETELMSGKIASPAVSRMFGIFGLGFQGIFDLWLAAGLIVKRTEGDYELSGSGCWFLDNMVHQIRSIRPA